MYGTLSDDETHYKHRIRFDKFSSANNTARVELQNIHNLLITELTSVSLGGVHNLNKGKIDWDLSYYDNKFKYGNIPDKQNNSYYVIKYTQSGVGINPIIFLITETGQELTGKLTVESLIIKTLMHSSVSTVIRILKWMLPR
jgi:hypothetical protein